MQVRKQDELNSLQNDEELEARCSNLLREMRRLQNIRDTDKTESELEEEEQIQTAYQDILKKREMLLRIRDDIHTLAIEEEDEFRNVIDKPRLLQDDQSGCQIS